MPNDEADKKAETQELQAKEKKPPPTQEELMEVFEGMVIEAEAMGRRDAPGVLRARELLDRREKKEDASKKR
jgi:hypothetical protein